MALRAALQAYYKFDNSGADDSKHKRSLDFTGAEAYATGKLGNGYDLPGNEANFADRGTDDPVLSFAGSGARYTIQFWFNPTTLSGGGRVSNTVVEKWNSGTSRGWSFAVDLTGSVSFVHAAAATLTTAAGLITTGSFHHIAVIANGTTIKIYVNNVERASTAFVANTLVTNVLRVGDSTAAVSPVDGVTDELALWNRALSTTELSQLYNSGAGLSIPGLGTSVKQLNVGEPFPSFVSTVAGLPSAVGLFGHYAMVSDASGGATMAFSDNVVWRRWSDRTVVS
jgi:hypothetical protein